MSWSGRAKRTGIALSLALAGCAAPGGWPSADVGFQGRGAVPPTVLPVVAPAPTPLDLSALPAAVDRRAHEERGLAERECLVLAARNSSAGNLLDLKARQCLQMAGADPGQEPCDVAPGQVQTDVLGVSALEARNASAGSAMELYYRLAQAHAQRAVVGRSLAAIDRLKAEQARGVANYGERVEADLKRLEAESTLWEKVFDWKVAEVKLRQAQFALLP